MKIKQEIEWVVGENPGEPSVKLVVVEHEGGVEVTTGSFSRCDSTSEPRWYYTNNAEIPYWTSSVLAWASMPHYHGFPAEGQKVEFTNVHKCEQEHPDPVPEEKVIGWAETTVSKPKKRSKGPKPPEFIYADYADRKWAFYGSLRAQRSNRPDLKPIKLKVVEA